MIYAIVFYWLISGFATWMLPTSQPMPRGAGAFIFVFCMLLGGIIIPARAIAKAVR